MTRRPGMSLTEVLVALFILTLGVIGILTMFPLGAAQMARAVRDDRSALAAMNADAYMRWYWQTYVVPDPLLSSTQTLDSQFTPGTGVFDSPPGLPPLILTQTPTGQQSFGQMSYPVVVDPMGYLARGQNFGDTSPSGYSSIPRRSLLGITSQTNATMCAYRNCSLVDSLTYNDNGFPGTGVAGALGTPGTGTCDLEMRYNWLYVLQRPQFINEVNTTNLYTVNMTVVVFDRRTLLYPPSAVQGFEVVIPGVTFTSGLSTVTISAAASQQALDLKPGTWVMDATINPSGAPYPIRQANFYRVVSVGPAGTTLEFQTPILPPTGNPPLGYTYTGTLVALRGVSGVFVRPPLTPY